MCTCSLGQMYFKAGKNGNICANAVSDTPDGLTDNFSVGWSCLRFVCVGWERECWQDVIGTITHGTGHTPEHLKMISIRGSLNTSLSYHNTSQPTETAPSTSEMQFHPLNLSVQGLRQEWEDRLYLRFDSEPYTPDYNAATGEVVPRKNKFPTVTL